MNKRQRRKRKKQESSSAWQGMAAAVSGFIQSTLRQPSFTAQQVDLPAGQWRDAAGIVHAVNALSIASYKDIDLGRQTVCDAAYWSPEEPRRYPMSVEDDVDCMTCISAGAAPCP